MKPEDVNPGNFKVQSVLYDNGDFSIAIGIWENKNKVLGMRWNGDSDSPAGYPKTFGHPMWFIVHDDLKLVILQSLLSAPKAFPKKIVEELNEEIRINL